jgi:hypothetical protein
MCLGGRNLWEVEGAGCVGPASGIRVVVRIRPFSAHVAGWAFLDRRCASRRHTRFRLFRCGRACRCRPGICACAGARLARQGSARRKGGTGGVHERSGVGRSLEQSRPPLVHKRRVGAPGPLLYLWPTRQDPACALIERAARPGDCFYRTRERTDPARNGYPRIRQSGKQRLFWTCRPVALLNGTRVCRGIGQPWVPAPCGGPSGRSRRPGICSHEGGSRYSAGTPATGRRTCRRSMCTR